MSQTKMIMDFAVDLQKPLVTQVMVTTLQQGDSNANVLRIELINGNEKPEIVGNTVSGYFMRADGERVMLEGTIEGNVIAVTLEASCYQVAGPAGAFVRLVNNEGVKRTILRIATTVESEGDGPVIDPGHRIPSVEDVIAKLEEMEAAINEAEEKAGKANSASEKADASAEKAEAAAEAAEVATTAANAAAASIEGMTVSAQHGVSASAEISTIDGVKHIDFTLPRGETGKPFKILGTYASLDDLNAAVPSPEQGDIYNVGAEEPYSMYMWDTTGGAGHWLYLGELGSGGSGTVQSVDGVLADEDGNVAVNAVRYDGQTLNVNQQAVARNNISVYSKGEVDTQIYYVKTVSKQVAIPADGWRGEDPFFYETAMSVLADRNCIFVNPIPSQIREYANCGIYLSSFNGAAFRFVASKKPSSTMYIDIVGLKA